MRADGDSVAKIAEALGVHRGTVYRICLPQNKPREPCGGRPRSITPRDEAKMLEVFQRHRALPLRRIQREHLSQYSLGTLRRYFTKLGFSSCSRVSMSACLSVLGTARPVNRRQPPSPQPPPT
ncbi:unnamed protein product [Mesocestoides corti]|nr:unnamed protein product [Mesocestoides corti]